MKRIRSLKIALTAILLTGSLNLFAQEKTLKEVAIKGTKNIIKQEVDRITYDLQADPESKVSNVLEMMRKLPFVTVDIDQNILLKGNTSYKILINGKPSSMMERDAKNILRSMPASTIQRIEVYTTPPARFDAEGLGGIINIITVKKISDGYNGTLNLNARHPLGVGAGTSLTIKTGKFGLSAFGGLNKNDNPATTTSNTLNSTGTNPTSLNQDGSATSGSRSGYFGTDLSYEIDSLNLVSGQVNVNGNRNNGHSYQSSSLSRIMGLPERYELNNGSESHGAGFDASLNYQRGFKNNKTKLLTFSYRYWAYDNDGANNILFGNRVNYPTPNYNQYNNTHANEQTFQVDYVQKIKKVLVEAGVKGIMRNYDSDFELDQFNNSSGQFERNNDLSNQFNGTQNILAAYNTWQFAIKKLEVKAGLRIEQTVTDADFVSTTTTVHQNYLNVLPSIAINLPLKNNSSFNLGFSQRLKRPGINKLNPYVDRSNPNFQSSGNPELNRVLMNDIKVGYNLSRKANLNISAFYDFASGLDILVTTFDKATNITYTTYKNLGDVIGIGGNISFSYPITKQLNFSNNINTIYFELTGPIDGITRTNSFVTFSMSTSATYGFNNGWRLGLNLDVNGRNPTGLQGSSNGFASTGLNVSKQLIKNKLSFSASVRNPFTKYRYSKTETSGNDFTQTVTNQQYFRGFNASLNYNFGRLKESIKKAKRGINNDDGAK